MEKNLLVACVFSMATFAAAAQAETVFSGDLGFSAGVNSFSNSDDSEEASENTFSLNGHVRAEMGIWTALADFNYVRRDVPQDEWDDYLPEGASSLGLHFGRQFNGVYAGAFVGKNWFQGDDSTSGDGYVDGTLWGVEAEYMLSPNTALFGQVGMANMVGDEDDSEFDGHFARIGMAHTVNKLTLAMDYEFGRSPDIFEDDDDWGEYKAFTISAEYQFKPRLIGTFSLSQMDITANTEDNGDETVVEVGLRIPFGSNYKRNNLTTTYRPGLAAAWAEALD